MKSEMQTDRAKKEISFNLRTPGNYKRIELPLHYVRFTEFLISPELERLKLNSLGQTE